MTIVKTMLTVTACAECMNKENVDVIICYWDLKGAFHLGPVTFRHGHCARCGSDHVCHYSRPNLKGIWNASDGFSKWSRGTGAERKPLSGPRE